MVDVGGTQSLVRTIQHLVLIQHPSSSRKTTKLEDSRTNRRICLITEEPDNQAAPLFDAHLHLQDERYSGRFTEIIDRARIRGVRGFCCCASAEDDWDGVARIARECSDIVPSFGLHPWYIDKRTSRWREGLEEVLSAFPSAGVGEIGLDRAVEVDFARQEEVFTAQLRIARQAARPVSIHCRRAWEPLLTILRRESEAGLFRAMIHSYSGSAALVPEFEKLDLFISFSGSITHDRNRRGWESAAKVSGDRLLIETDSPDILPAGVSGPLNEPGNLPLVAGALARIRGISTSRLAGITSYNARRLFLDQKRSGRSSMSEGETATLPVILSSIPPIPPRPAGTPPNPTNYFLPVSRVSC